MTIIKEFLAKNPSLSEIYKFINEEAQRIANERKTEIDKLQRVGKAASNATEGDRT